MELKVKKQRCNGAVALVRGHAQALIGAGHDLDSGTASYIVRFS